MLSKRSTDRQHQDYDLSRSRQSVSATTCRVQEKEQDRTGAFRVRKLLLVKVENSQVLTSRSRLFSGRILTPSYEPQMQVVSLLRHKSPSNKNGVGPCIRSTLGRMAAGILRVDSEGVDIKTSSCRYRVLLTADDICVKVLDQHDLRMEGRSMRPRCHFGYEKSKDRAR